MPIRFRHNGIQHKEDGGLDEENEGVIRGRQAGSQANGSKYGGIQRDGLGLTRNCDKHF